MKCCVCGKDMILYNVFSYEDYGYNGNGIVSLYGCKNNKCNAEIEVRIPLDDNDT